MFEDNPMLSLNVKLWKFLWIIINHSWQVYTFVVPIGVMNILQFVYLFYMKDLVQFILNTFFFSAILDALLRVCLVLSYRNRFEALMTELNEMYLDIENSDDDVSKRILKSVTKSARRLSIFNLSITCLNAIGAVSFPMLSTERIHPFGIAIPGVDVLASPIYEIIYILQSPAAILLSAMYLPFVSLFASFAMFGTGALKILQHRLQHVGDDGEQSEPKVYESLIVCVKYHARIVSYIKDFNLLVTYIVLVEFLLFGVIICSLLFCINIVGSFNQIFTLILYIMTMLYFLYTYYGCANDLYVESLNVSEAAYAMQWYQCSERTKKIGLLFIMRTQKPLKIMVGNVYPMTLETFQALLNVSYTYFTMLRGVYSK